MSRALTEWNLEPVSNLTATADSDHRIDKQFEKVCSSAGDSPNDVNHTPLKTMTFKINSKIKAIYEKSTIDPSKLKPEMLWDSKNPPKPIWDKFNIITPGENTDNRSEL